MKKLLYSLTFACLAVNIQAQAPQKFSYQTVIRNSSNQLISNQQVGIKISVLQGSETGIVVYSELHTPNTNANGLATLSIGTGSVLSGSFQNINWGSGSYYIQTETDPNGGNNYTITSTQQLLSVPYALYAETSGSSTPGPQGVQGPIGQTGPEGPQGLTGATGPQGPIGLTGPAGATGQQGPIGLTGNTGAIGATGPVGATGPQGPEGPIGLTGLTGATGPAGSIGPQGPIGLTGATGPAGAIGATGPQGLTGPTGAAGATGPQGPIGTTGPAGSNGKNSLVKTTSEFAGATCATGGVKMEYGIDANSNGTLDISEVNNTLTKYVCNGTAGAQGAQGIQGEVGPQGPITPGTFNHYIGEVFEGGIIFHLWKDNLGQEHGLIVDLTDLSSEQTWSNSGNGEIGPTARSTWDGNSNSNSIINQDGHVSSAALLCLNSTNSGYDDWYLPSVQEFNLIWYNMFQISKVLTGIPSAQQFNTPESTTSRYWTSNEYNSNFAYFFAFDDPYLGFAAASYSTKGTLFKVRAIRAF
jgi:hypothetical protein